MQLFTRVGSTLWVSIIIVQWSSSVAVVPTAKIDVRSTSGGMSTSLLASQASFGSNLPMGAKNNLPMLPVFPSNDNPLLCNKDILPATTTSSIPQVMMVPRGGCAFEEKAIAALHLGASAVIVYGTLASRYSLNVTNVTDYQYTTNDIIYPRDKSDYDCDKASAQIPLDQLSFSPLPYDSNNDPKLTSTTQGGNGLLFSPGDSCVSQRALLTGRTTPENNPTSMEACCAWDTYIWLYNDQKFTTLEQTLTFDIPSVYITIKDAGNLLNAIQSDPSIMLTLYRRDEPEYNLSALLIWALGVFVAALASYMSASEYRNAKNIIVAKLAQRNGANNINTASSDETRTLSTTTDGTRSRSKSPGKVHSEPSQQQALSEKPLQDLEDDFQNEMSTIRSTPREEELELGVGHAVGFVVFASGGLLTLFFLKAYSVVKVFYAFGCSSSIMQVIFLPLYQRIAKKFNVKDRNLVKSLFCDLGPLSLLEAAALVTSYGTGIFWLTISFTQRHPESNLFYWVMQDIMGACMCITFLNTIKLNSIKVASVLLIVAFLYDIFFVFITPLLTRGSESIMITVATSGGPPKGSHDWCEKYPDDKDCQGGNPLPMLFTIPRIADYRGGSSLLGLGDIVLPGLLLSFTARYDEAKRLLGIVRGGNGDTLVRCCCNGGYFVPVVIAYAIGLFMANAAVYLMNYGQPALLYLVPCCLGTVSFLGWRRGELSDLWDNPRALRGADSILYGDTPRSVVFGNSEVAAIATEANLGVAQNGQNDDSGNAPLLNLT
uniref:PA domain-containing protein n=1 Tax=Eucampia antarctica TaxID=49252 RepID=A0A7S2WGZ6_9STRA|mmetsp:Transcript_30030/g.28928  ORF Transcript_30030/g.28928 Transcript_30030/m.28928 type:complete len:773 (+) Transcript_30030:109-2427(+)